MFVYDAEGERTAIVVKVESPAGEDVFLELRLYKEVSTERAQQVSRIALLQYQRVGRFSMYICRA